MVVDLIDLYGLFRWDLLKEYSNCDILVENDKEDKEPKEELVDDVLQILNVYTAKLNGMRKYKK